MTFVRRMGRGGALRLILVLHLVAWVCHVEAGHEQADPIVKEKGLCETNASKACRYLRLEQCTWLLVPLPRIARTEPAPCPNGDPAGCLPDGRGGAYSADHGGVIVLPKGNDRWFLHEAIHHQRCLIYGDCASHDGPEWACVE